MSDIQLEHINITIDTKAPHLTGNDLQTLSQISIAISLKRIADYISIKPLGNSIDQRYDILEKFNAEMADLFYSARIEKEHPSRDDLK